MNTKRWRHFLVGFLIGAGGLYWYTVHGEDTFYNVVEWLQREADEYRATHPTPEADAGWRPKQKRASDR